MVNLEFRHYDYKLRGTISAKDFALSMVASADLKHLKKLLDRVDDIDKHPDIQNIRITPEEFKSFSDLRKKLQPLSLALIGFREVNGLLTKKDLQRAAHQVRLCFLAFLLSVFLASLNFEFQSFLFTCFGL